MKSKVIQLRKDGSLTLPLEFRRKYSLNEGGIFTLIDLEAGTVLFTLRVSQVNKAGDQVTKLLADEGISSDDLLIGLEEERERYYQEHFADKIYPSS